MSDPAVSGAAKQQAVWDAENKKLQLQSNAMKQREDSMSKKVQALQQSQPNYSAGNSTKGWNSNKRSQGKGKGKHTSQRQQQWSNEDQQHSKLKPYRSPNPGWQPPAKGKQKGTGGGNAKRYKKQQKW